MPAFVGLDMLLLPISWANFNRCTGIEPFEGGWITLCELGRPLVHDLLCATSPGTRKMKFHPSILAGSKRVYDSSASSGQRGNPGYAEMINSRIIGALLPTAARTMRRWLFHLGGLGLIPLGLLDNSPIPLPGAMDVATILLSARQEQLWLYYALMATAGSVIGGFVTYRLARKGGKEALEHRFSRRQVDKVTKIFGRWGFGAIAVPAFLPPPVPIVPFLLAAGAMQYPVRRFLAALALGRIPRYMILAYVAKRYGRQIIAFIRVHGHPVVLAIILVLIAATALVFYFRGKLRRKSGRGN